ncbi:hypothetical protein ABVK25_003278 [Lepraria finkii]|uniref:Uncharacterized protein n=1 Tax=Lepraria finkii TaxID=1340010 RepID=A0ABR4BEG8_9LECA
MSSPPQALVAQHLLLSGCALCLSGLLWGPFVGSTTYPRLALGAHIQFTLSEI